MLSNKEISNLIKINAQLLELHDGNAFKIKSLTNAAFRLGRIEQPLFGLDKETLESIEGIGKGVAAKIVELSTLGNISELQELYAKTPEGIVDIMSVKGLGPKKVMLIWKELEVESVGELLYACKENRLVDIKGFGEKTQAEVIKAIEFKMQHAGQHHYATIEVYAQGLLTDIKAITAVNAVDFTGEFYRKCPTIKRIDYVINCVESSAITSYFNTIYTLINTSIDAYDNQIINYTTDKSIHVQFIISATVSLAFNQLIYSFETDSILLKSLNISNSQLHNTNEKDLFAQHNLPYLLPEVREDVYTLEQLRTVNNAELVCLQDLCGILHFHTTYSDGKHTLTQMANYAQQIGIEYIGVCDHSQSAFYANGLTPDRVEQQHLEIKKLNKTYTNGFKILKGIECDILNNGDLDYEPAVLDSFDFIVASVHSNLKMNKTKATDRVLRAIHHPHTNILGHPTGRLLLSRPGYELDWNEIINACATQKVVLELNAHPYRLDIDWTLINQAQNAGCLISINPDSHEMKGFHDLQYGVHVARKGLLKKQNVLNALSLQEFVAYLTKKSNR
ncbi:MAG: PHP domain-containing protein [Bacteroidia bacterium]|nr:PHP domain-containing protein [Bacteroidia bacterium]